MMAAFRYTATDLSGRKLNGVIEADSGRQARSLLREQNLFPASVEPVADAAAKGSRQRNVRVSASDLVLLTRRWSVLLASGLPLENALNALIEQVEGDNVRTVIVGVRAEILAGHPLSAGLARFPRIFSELFVGLVRAGEKTGDLATVLARIADHLEARQQARRKLVQALAYPVLVSLVAIAIVIALMTYVVPKVVAVFVHAKQTLPLLTRGLIALSDLIRDWGWLFALALVAAALAWRYAMRREEVRYRWHAALLRVAVLGRLLKSIDSTRFAATMAILVGSGVPLMQALAAARDTVRNLRVREAVTHAIERVREGAPIARALGAEKVFPPMMIHLIASGEASGTLAPMLQRAADQQDMELDHFTTMAVAIFEPALIVFMGLIVVLIVLAILMPIMEVNQLVI